MRILGTVLMIPDVQGGPAMTGRPPRVLYDFDRFRLDPHQRLLFAEGASTSVPLPPRVFETLLYLVQRPGVLLSKGELLKAIWPGVAVEENGLNQHVSMLRRVLGETPGDHRFIVTVPGRGYRFVADVREVEWHAEATQNPVSAQTQRPPPPAQDPEAHDLFVQALSLSLRPSPQNTRGAIELLREALRRDEKFARAASLLALQYAACVIFDFPMPDALNAAERQAERALTLDPGDGSTHGAVGVLEAVRGNWLGSAIHFRTARALGSDAFTGGAECGYLTQSVGHVRRAVEDAERIFREAPAQPMGAQMLALGYLCQGRDSEARQYADLSRKLGQSESIAPLPEIYALLALRTSRFAEAAEQLIAALSPRLRAAGGSAAVEHLCAALRDPSLRAAASTALDDLEARLQPEDFDQPMRKRLLLWRAMLGNFDAAYAFLDRCLEHYARSGTVGSAWGFLWLPEMKAFRRDARFQLFIGRVGFIDYWREYGPPDDCELRGSTLICN
jgi:DNA-binding winged helix-turn-helix (wHTH) protein